MIMIVILLSLILAALIDPRLPLKIIKVTAFSAAFVFCLFILLLTVGVIR
jgi:hypothetical protein